MSSSEVGTIFKAHVVEREFWAEVANSVHSELEKIVRSLRVPGKVESRAKTTGSVVGKAFRKPEDYGILSDFGDLAGARLLVAFEEHIDPVVEEIETHPDLEITEDDLKLPGPDDLRYQARHLQLLLAGGLVPARYPSIEADRDIGCEVQIQTFAQSLWANTSHLISYNRSLPDDVSRRVNRLIALCEIFDDEATAARDLALEFADDIEVIAAELQKYFHAVTGEESNPDQALSLVGKLIGSLTEDERSAYPAMLDSFIQDHGERVADLLTDRPWAREIPLLMRPESLLIFERLENGAARLRGAWVEYFPERDLDDLAAAWGPTLS